MDYYQTVVLDYLRADRSLFLNPETCIQLNPHANPDLSGPHWYCDAVVADFHKKRILLVEISYAAELGSLKKRLLEWNLHWREIRVALHRDCFLPVEWDIIPWLFIPKDRQEMLVHWIESHAMSTQGFKLNPLLTHLESVQPWKYCSWDRTIKDEKPDTIPLRMRP